VKESPRILVDPVGIPEIAGRIGVKRQTVDNWRQQPETGFPPPEAGITIGGRPVWQWAPVGRWCDETGRVYVLPTCSDHAGALS
jgi:hypothetical protein